MRLVTVRTARGPRAGRIDADVVTLLPFADVGALLRSRGDWQAAARGAGPQLLLSETHLAPVVPHPSKIVCLGLNYRAHITEMGRELPRFPTLFAKFAEALTGPNDAIPLPAASECVDWEGELGVIVGRQVRHADVDVAAAAIAGFTVANDITARDWQRRSPQWLQGKTWEATTPLGPALVTPDEAGGTAPDLHLQVWVDGEPVQDARTGDLVFAPAECVAYISSILTLNPGDVILTGTPGGVGDARKPQRYLAPGQVLQTRIEGLGTLVNPCGAEQR